MTDANGFRARLVAELSRRGWLTTPEWQETFGAVPRHRFLRRFFTLTADRSQYDAVDASHPEWLELAYRNAVWATQLDGDDSRWVQARTHGAVTGTPTCSSTQPSLMAIMLEALDLHDGHRVLEIGTGTGYNAALLAHRLGNSQVVSVEVDANLAEETRAALTAAGYAPTVAVVDGANGHSGGAPYDRLIATCSVAAVPLAWLAQMRPGGLVLLNLYRQLVGGALVGLTIREDGSATGHLLDDWGGFMPLRAHARGAPAQLVRAASTQEGVQSESRLPAPISADGAKGQTWVVLADLLMRETARIDIARAEGNVQWLVDPDGSWAYYETSTGLVEQGGRRRLWDELERIRELWADHGEPTRNHIGLTVPPGGEHHVWLHDEANVVTQEMWKGNTSAI
jgi:protein-L-isoaspartate(D-aspartate) O-methyltransferase